KELRVDKGVTMKRMMPAAMGSAHRINKRTSHLNIILGERENKVIPIKKARQEIKQEVKKEKIKKLAK
ncbi:MAG: large ribosomal subunit protein uL22, partial [Minisyncoccia bacterium]